MIKKKAFIKHVIHDLFPRRMPGMPTGRPALLPRPYYTALLPRRAPAPAAPIQRTSPGPLAPSTAARTTATRHTGPRRAESRSKKEHRAHAGTHALGKQSRSAACRPHTRRTRRRARSRVVATRTMLQTCSSTTRWCKGGKNGGKGGEGGERKRKDRRPMKKRPRFKIRCPKHPA